MLNNLCDNKQMNIIPVIDLKDNLVVAAQQGSRDNYQPISSNLCQSSNIEDVIESFLSIYPFKNIYIADLNAITDQGNNDGLIISVIRKNPAIEFWVDSGKSHEDLSLITDNNYRPIIGSESQKTTLNYNITDYGNSPIVSLDFFPSCGYSGPKELLVNPDFWSKDIIVMTLEKVGKNSGPDFEKLTNFCQKHPDKTFIAAGGVRGKEDLIRLKEIGINHALIASALHNGKINKQTIKKLISI